ncbi:MAG: hypothetical protein OHK0015_19570 [Chloroflexi bacterium OHK40]
MAEHLQAVPGDGPDSELIARAQAYEAEAVSELYRRYADLIYRYIYYRVGDPTVAEDLLADVFLRALEGLPEYRERGRPFEAWLYSIAHNKVVDHFRRQRVRRSSPLHEGLAAEPGAEPQQQALQREAQRLAWGAVARLTDDQQQVVTLRFIAGYSIAEVAEQLGKTEGAIKALQSRALAALRKLLGDDRGR